MDGRLYLHSAKKQQGVRLYLRDLKTRKADKRAHTSLVEEFHRCEKPVRPNGLLHLGIFYRRREEGEDVIG